MDDFDHVKNDRVLEATDIDENAEKESNIKKEGMSEDMQRMMQKLNSTDSAKVLPLMKPLRISFRHCLFDVVCGNCS